MKTIDGQATAMVGAGIDETFVLLAAVDAYPRWNGELVPAVEVLERDGQGAPAVVRMRLHVAQSPIGKDFALTAGIHSRAPGLIELASVEAPTERDRVALTWSLTAGAGTRIDLRFQAQTPRLPGFIPLFGVGNQIAAYLIDGVARALARGE